MSRRSLICPLLLICSMLARAAGQAPQLESRLLDEMDDVSPWRSLVSDGVSASVHGAKGVEGGALVLEFDLAGTAGYAAATRALPTELPEDYEITFWLRGEAGRNHLEIKFVDASGENVWWYRRADYPLSGDWQPVRIKRRHIEFAWGPAADRTLRRFESIELVVSAGRDGGQGSLWFDRLMLKPIEKAPPPGPPGVRATSERAGHEAALALDGHAQTHWRSAGREAQTVHIDLHAVREFGGIEIDWAPDLHAKRYTIETSLDGARWQKVSDVAAGNGGRDSHLLPESEARHVRIRVPPGREAGIAEVHLRDLEFGASPNAFVEVLAQRSRRGCYPRAYLDEQSYWTIVGVDGADEESMLSEDGALEVRKGSFSIEPFVHAGDGWLTWADASLEHALEDGYLPIPRVTWMHPAAELTVVAYASGTPKAPYTHAVYRLRNPAKTARRYTLALAIRPFQVNSPAQFLNTTGGVSPIHDVAYEGRVVHVDGKAAVFTRNAPQDFRAATLSSDSPCEWLAGEGGTTRVHDSSGFASGALLYEMTLEAGASRDVVIDLPLHGGRPSAASTFPSMEEVAARWRADLNRVELVLPQEAASWFDTLRTSLAHVLINRDGPALQPGSRAYERSWIRDGAMTSEMLLRLGHAETAVAFLRWYAPYQFDNGKVPCCVDRRGADPVPENDSHGQFLFLIDAIHRYTGDEALLRELWPAVQKTVTYMDALRESERTKENTVGERKAFYGLMPASISHEGYAAKPMHSYWDNFWALAGYESAVRIARALERKEQMRELIASRDQFRSDVYRSLQIAMRQHGIDYLPGAAELGDFDATSTSIALAPVGEQQMLPPLALQATFERYWKNFRERQEDTTWDAYTPYEWRNLGTFVRLRWRERALDLIEFLMDDRRPAGWHQWAEVVGREPRRVRFIGDMPHGWVASDYGRSLLDMFAFERQADETLVLMAGVPESWTRKEGFAVRRLRTPFGQLSYSLTVSGRERVLDVSAIRLPAGGMAIAWPEGHRPEQQTIRRGSARWIGTELRVTELPLTISFAQ